MYRNVGQSKSKTKQKGLCYSRADIMNMQERFIVDFNTLNDQYEGLVSSPSLVIKLSLVDAEVPPPLSRAWPHESQK